MSACFVLYVTCFSHNMLRQFYNELLNVKCLPFLNKTTPMEMMDPFLKKWFPMGFIQQLYGQLPSDFPDLT